MVSTRPLLSLGCCGSETEGPHHGRNPVWWRGHRLKWAEQLLAELADGLETDAVDGYLAGEDRPSTVVEPKPRATGLTLDEIVADHLDYLHHEAFFVVSTTFEVTAYRTLWFGLQYDSETVEQGETVGNARSRDRTLVRRRAGR